MRSSEQGVTQCARQHKAQGMRIPLARGSPHQRLVVNAHVAGGKSGIAHGVARVRRENRAKCPFSVAVCRHVVRANDVARCGGQHGRPCEIDSETVSDVMATLAICGNCGCLQQRRKGNPSENCEVHQNTRGVEIK